MKNLLTVGVAIILLTAIYISCKKSTEEPRNTSTQNEISSSMNSEKKFHIYFATWDEWGRTRRNCAGWGLCNFQDCWFCCTDDHDQVIDCQTHQRIANAGKITIDDETKQGDMIIQLDPSFPTHNDAINQRLTVYVDDNLENAKFIINAGEYLFDEHIGSFGGYRLNVTGK